MATTTDADTNAPWHHWPMAIISLLFYAVAALDYTFSQLGFGFYLNNFPVELVDFVRGMPAWLEAIWAVGTWGGLLGAWLLWRRNRWSVLLLFVGAVVFGFMTLWMSLFTRPTIFGMAGFEGFYVMVGSVAIAVLIYIYARWERTERKLA